MCDRSLSMTRIKELEAKEMTQRNYIISSPNAEEMRNKTNHRSLVCNGSHSKGVNITLYYFFIRHPPVPDIILWGCCSSHTSVNMPTLDCNKHKDAPALMVIKDKKRLHVSRIQFNPRKSKKNQ